MLYLRLLVRGSPRRHAPRFTSNAVHSAARRNAVTRHPKTPIPCALRRLSAPAGGGDHDY